MLINIDDNAFDVEIMTCVIDKQNDLAVVDSDSHFANFVGMHSSKIRDGELSFIELLHHRDRETIKRKIINSVYTYLDFDVKNKNGQYVYMRATGQNYPDSRYCRLTLVDVSQPVQKQEQLKAKAQTICNLIDLVSGGICLFKVDDDMAIEAEYVNEGFCRIFGTTKENFTSRNYRLDESVVKDDKSKLFQAIGKAMATKKSVDIDFRIKKQKNEVIWVKFVIAVHHYDEDECPVFHAVVSDITVQKVAEQTADRRYEMLVKLFKNLPGTFFCCDDETPFQLEFASSEFYEVLGYKKSEFVKKFGNDLTKAIPDEECKKAYFDFKSKSNANPNDEIEIEYSIESKDGSFVSVVDTRKIIDLENGDNTTLGVIRLKGVCDCYC